MAKIHVLDKQTAEQIAAGEVIEKPASVVKELIENAIDAGATTITVEIKNGGVTFLRVTDNGCGIEREDVPTAFLRHATSKVQTAEDLNAIYTLGFRGEALASICAVAKVELLTKTASQPNGTRYVVEGGEEKFLDDAGCPDGTTILVRDLFYNVPARMKFLKKDVSEGNAVAAIMDKMALANPQVSFRFINAGAEKLFTPGDSNQLSAIYAVLGKPFAESLVPVHFEDHGLFVTGFISRPTASRPNRRMQHFFLNGRYIRSQLLTAALEEAYKHTIMVGKFPACVLNIKLPPNTVDVNVHPAKLEVRFADEKRMFQLIFAAVKNTLMGLEDRVDLKLSQKGQSKSFAQPTVSEQLRMSAEQFRETYGNQSNTASVQKPASTEYTLHSRIEMQDVQKGSTFKQPSSVVYQTSVPKSELPPIQKELVSSENLDFVQKINNSSRYIKKTQIDLPTTDTKNLQDYRSAQQPTAEKQDQDALPKHYRVVGEVFATYIILEYQDEMLLVDKHAAHERILYEQIRKDAKLHKQMLLEPVTVNLPKEEYDAAIKHLELFSEVGFDTEDFGDGMLIVRSVPSALIDFSVEGMVEEIAQEILSHKRSVIPENLDWLYHSIACRAAIKANDKSSKWELQQLAAILEQNRDIQYCPHGRPIYVRLTKKELEKQFGRLG